MSGNKKVVRIIRKSNDLVEGRYHFNMWETRVFTKMLTLINKDDEDFKEYRIFLKDVVQDFDLKDKNSYAWIKKGAEGLAKKEIRVVRQTDEGEKEFLTHIAIGVESFTKNGNYVDISFHPRMKPFLLQLQTQFLMYDVENIINLQSFYSIRIYELLKQYERIGKRQITIKELKEMLAIEDKYPQYGHFKSRIILKAQEDLASATDISFDFEEIKKGRQIVALSFFIKSNRSGQKALPDTREPVALEKPSLHQALYDKIANFSGATEATLHKWIEKYDVDYVATRIDYVCGELKKRVDITNPMGLLQTLMNQKNFVSPLAEQTKMKQAEKQLRLEREQERMNQQQIDAARKDLFQRYRAAMFTELEKLLASDDMLGSKFISELKKSDNNALHVQLALDNYKRILSGPEGNAQEILFNFESGGSFSFALEEWLTKQYPIFKKLQQHYFSRLENLR